MCNHILLLIIQFAALAPSPLDKDGLGLRIRGAHVGPYLVGEHIAQDQVTVSLLNFSPKPQLHDPLSVALRSNFHILTVRRPDGQELTGMGIAELNRTSRNPFTVQTKLPPGSFVSTSFAFEDLGYEHVFSPGMHQIEARLNLVTNGVPDGRVLKAPTFKFQVLELNHEATLSQHKVPLEGREATLPIREQRRFAVQQVQVGERVILIYRRYRALENLDDIKPERRPLAEIDGTHRLAELPGKCDVTVTGAYGDWKPLTITYKTSPTAEPVKLVINSVDGKPWTAEEERQLQQRLKRVAAQPKKP